MRADTMTGSGLLTAEKSFLFRIRNRLGSLGVWKYYTTMAVEGSI
jgi:hypothetical protein